MTASRPAPSGRRPLGAPLKFLLGLAVAAAVLAAFEALLHLALGPLSPPVQVHSAAGELEQWLVEDRGRVRTVYQKNPVGFSASPRGPRIAVLGGSSVHAGNPRLQLHEEFPSLLGEELGMESLNLGRPAIDSHDVRRILEELSAYEFAAWVVYTGHNDFGNTYFFQRYKDWSSPFQITLDARLKSLQLYWLLRGSIAPHANSLRDGLGWENFQGSVDRVQLGYALQHLEMNLRRIIWLSRSSGTPLVLVVPAGCQTSSEKGQCRPLGNCEAGKACARKDYDLGMQLVGSEPSEARKYLDSALDADSVPLRIPTYAQDLVRRLAAETGTVLVDAPLLLPREDGVDLVSGEMFHDHVHLSGKGQHALAGLIAPAVRGVIGK
jgi:hypothetical protein